MKSVIYLHETKQATMMRGHPWIFPKAIARQSHVKTGHLVHIYNEHNVCLGFGVYNEHSLYRVRVLALASEHIDTSSIEQIVRHRVIQALTIRESLNLPNAKTNAYRLVNSEGDGLSGLTIDRFNDTCVIASSAYWVEANKTGIEAVIREFLPNDDLIWLPQAKPLLQDGWADVEEASVGKKCVVLEAGVQYEVDFANVQKTGLFLDQRENHQRIGALCKNKKVLDLYTYTGGFALHAALSGAAQVTAVDSSANAILRAKHNAMLNDVNQIEFVEEDARHYLEKVKDYDIVILDPPKLVPSQKHIERAKNYYRYLHREVFKSMRSGSLLMTCNCSSALSADQFAKLVSLQATAVGKVVRIIGIYGPASCHPTLMAFPEGQYLTAILLAVV